MTWRKPDVRDSPLERPDASPTLGASRPNGKSMKVPGLRFTGKQLHSWSPISGSLLAPLVAIFTPRRRKSQSMDAGILLSPRLNSPTALTPDRSCETAQDSATPDFENWLGAGSSGVITKGTWRGHAVAIKKMKTEEEYAADGITLLQGKEDLQREAEALKAINHPQIIKLVAVHQTQDSVCLVQELMSSGSVKDYCAANFSSDTPWVPPADLVIKWCGQLAFAVEYLHGLKPEPMLHRDIKPDNCLLDESLDLKLADFGKSWSLREARELEGGGYMMTGGVGSVRYIAPEVTDLDADGMAAYDTSADVYSMTMTMWFFATAKDPFTQANPTTLADKVLDGLRPSVSDPRIARMHAAFERFVPTLVKGWSQDRAKRPTAAEMARHFRYNLAATRILKRKAPPTRNVFLRIRSSAIDSALGKATSVDMLNCPRALNSRRNSIGIRPRNKLFRNYASLDLLR